MRLLCTVIIFIVTVLMISSAADKESFTFKQQPELQQIKPKKPVKIRLKRTSKDDYTWELSGDDVDEIVKTDRRLRQMLKVQ